MGNWHHPRERREDGTFLPAMEYGLLLKDAKFKDWHDHYRSKSGRRQALITVYRFMKAGNLESPSQFLELPPHEAKALIRRVVHRLQEEGHYEGARMALSFGKGFYNYHNIDLGSEIKFKDSVKNRAIGLGNRAIILCLWQSGVRGSTLCRLTFGMVKEKLYPTVKVPIPLKITDRIDTKISQYGLGYYYTFLAGEAAKALRGWLDARIEARDKMMNEEDPLFTVFDMDQNDISDKPMKRDMVLNAVKTAVGRAGLNPDGIWSHCLRKSFRNVLNRNYRMDEDTKEALMGHKLLGSRANYFDVHDIEEIAEKYMKCDWTPGAEFALESLESKVTLQKAQQEALRRQLEARSKREELERELENAKSEINKLKSSRNSLVEDKAGLEQRIHRTEEKLVELTKLVEKFLENTDPNQN